MFAGTSPTEAKSYDVVIVGAGISGINTAYRVQTELPDFSYTILEARERMGGTWDLFRYPGIRSDSDLHTFGFVWRPWTNPKCIAEGEAIRQYLQESAAESGVDQKIQYRNKLTHANWSSDQSAWQLTVDANGTTKHIHARFLVLASGYYDYNNPLKAEIPGIENFQGKTIHPQFWPEDLDYTDENIVIIGSGATSVTLVPALAEKAKSVTMLQRSPGYVITRPAVDSFGVLARRWLPSWLSFRLVRLKFLVVPYLFIQFCRTFPNVGRSVIRAGTKKQLKEFPYDPHFNPKYNPFDQRLCLCPDGDFFKSLGKEKVDIVTDTIKTVTETGIETTNGTFLPADIIITATGLKIQIGGGSTISIDNEPFNIPDKFMWKGLMLQDLPNVGVVLGYTGASWTLGADATALHITRLLKYMKKNGYTAAIPTIKEGDKIMERPVLDLNSTYIKRAKAEMPKAGDVAPWKARSTYWSDMWQAKYGDVTQRMKFERVAS